MLTSLRLHDFQKHRDLTIQFGQVTTIIGPSDAGKSAVLRALRWLCLNRPAGEGYIRFGTKAAWSRVEVDGTRIVRRRGPGANLYVLGEQELRAFGSEVPDLIAGLLNLDDVNFQGQHDAPFWFSLTPGQVARELNRIVNLERIDRTQRHLQKKLTEARHGLGFAKERLAKAVQEQKRLAWVGEASKEWERIEERASTIARVRSTIDGIRDLSRRVRTLESSVNRALEIGEGAGLELQRIGERQERMRQREKEWADLGKLVKEIERKADEVWVLNDRSKRLEKERKRIGGKTCPLCGQVIRR